MVRGYTPDIIESILRGVFGGMLLAQWQLFDLMEETWPHLSKDLNELKSAVKSMELSVEPYAEKGKPALPADEDKAQFVEKALRGMKADPKRDRNNWGGTLYDLMDAYGKGLSVLEIDWMRSADGIVPADTRWIHPRYYGYPGIGADLMLDTTQINTQVNAEPVEYQPLQPQVQQFAHFPDNKFLISMMKRKSGHPLAGAMLRTLAGWWIAANFSQEWMLNFAQLFGQPFRWVEYDQTKPNLLALVSDMMENMGSAGWAAFPAGTKMEFKEAGKAGSDNPQAFLLTFADKICDIVVLGQTLTTDVGASGSRALGEVQEGVRGDLLEAAGDWVMEAVNDQFIPSLCTLNYGNADNCPVAKLGTKEIKDGLAMAQRDQVLSVMGLKFPVGYLYGRHDVPMPDAGEATIGGQAQPGPNDPTDPTDKTDPTDLADQPPKQPVQAKDASEQLAENVLEDLTGVQAKWLSGVKPVFQKLVVLAKSGKVSDAEFLQAIEKANHHFPEIFKRLDTTSLQTALENAMGTALVNGVAKGVMRRGAGAISGRRSSTAPPNKGKA